MAFLFQLFLRFRLFTLLLRLLVLVLRLFLLGLLLHGRLRLLGMTLH